MCDYKHPNQKKVINRMSWIIGHAEAIKKMLEEERDCSEVLIQISAVKSALNNVGKLVLKDHINHCVLEIIEDENDEILEKLDDAIDKFIK